MLHVLFFEALPSYFPFSSVVKLNDSRIFRRYSFVFVADPQIFFCFEELCFLSQILAVELTAKKPLKKLLKSCSEHIEIWWIFLFLKLITPTVSRLFLFFFKDRLPRSLVLIKHVSKREVRLFLNQGFTILVTS